MNKFNSVFKKVVLASAYCFAVMQSAYADDTEIFFAPASSTASIKPNVLFAIDTSGSMTGKIGGEQKINIVKDVMKDVLTDIQNVNAGLMRFNAGTDSGWDTAYGGPILYPTLDVDLPANPVVTEEIELGSNDGVENTLTNVNLTSQTLTMGGANSKYTALRFVDLNIPQGAKIKNASIAFTAKGNSADPAKYLIYGELTSNAGALATAPGGIALRALNRTVQDVGWIPNTWSDKEAYISPDITDVIQEIVDQATWCGNNDLLILVEDSAGGVRAAYSAEGEDAVGGGSDDTDAVVAPRIKIEFDNVLPGGANGCVSTATSSKIDRDSDDAETRYDDWSSDLDFHVDDYDNVTNNRVAVSFRNINVPQGANITNAYITFTSRDNRTNSASSTIKVVNDSTPVMGSSVIGLSNANFTGSVGWTIENWSTNKEHKTPDISSLVQAVVNRGDWASGNRMSFRFEGNTGKRRAYSHDSSSANAAKLTIEYSAKYTPGLLTIREDLKATVKDLNATGYTPISDTIAEAGQYFTGGKVTFGISRDGNRYNRMSHELSYDASGSPYTPSGCDDSNPNASACAGEKIIGNPNYVSPIADSCQPSHFVFLTDGAPTSHHKETEDIYKAWTGTNCNKGDPYDECSIAIAGYLHNNDVSPLAGKQTVTTHMIGFGSGADPKLMKDMATAGGGGHYSADNKAELVEALTQIVASIANVNTTFVTAGVTVNQYNRLTHNDELYYSLFSPQGGSVWPGNVKRYRLSGGSVVDINNKDAVDPLNGEFKDEAKSWWSSEVDGNSVREGGVASKLNTGRKIYSNMVSNNLQDTANLFNTNNVTAARLGAVDETDRKTIIHWARGYDVTNASYDPSDPSSTPAHRNFGDPLHSQPTVLEYNSSDSSKDKAVVYVGTNHGYLHAIDADSSSGKEMWSFIPEELLSMLTHIQKETPGKHRYGMDGAISIYVKDKNRNGAVDIDDGDKAYLYVGMRRGGSSYYALDISDPTAPNLMFSISPGRSGYGKLGQSWSRPVLAKMNLSGVNSDKLVVILGGGYDTKQDLAGVASVTDTVGNIIYIADAYTGAKLWDSTMATQAGGAAGPLTSMNAVPSDVTAFDLDDDGLIDHIYASDTKAQVFRFDVDNDTGKLVGGRIASLQSAADVANNRRFYYSPDAALIRLQKESFVSVSIGSGYRAHPLDENVTDHFYMIKDKGVLSGTFDMDAKLSDLTDVTNLVGDANNNGTSDAQEIIYDKVNPSKGWYIGFADVGEKVIERSLTFNNAVIFTSYIPPSSSSSVCQAAAGGGRVYALQIVDGNPYVDTNYDGKLDKNDRSIDLASSGIAPQPQIVYTDKPRLCVGTACSGDGGFLPDSIIPPIPSGLTGIRWQKQTQ